MLESIGFAAAYTGVGIALLVLGFYALDLLTPGHLGRHIAEDRSVNAALDLAGGFLGQGAIVFASIWTNATSGFGQALLYTVVFGILGVVLQAVAFVVLDLITPGSSATTSSSRSSTRPAWSAPPSSWRSRRSSSPPSGPDPARTGPVTGAARPAVTCRAQLRPRRTHPRRPAPTREEHP